MLDFEFAGEFVETDTPVYLRLFTNGKTICVREDMGGSDKGFAEVRFKVGVPFKDLDVR